MSNTLPPVRAFTVRKSNDENKKDIWIAIGAAWPHRDEKGFDVILDALPLDGHIVLRVNEPRSEDKGHNNAPQRGSFNKSDRSHGARRSGGREGWKRS